MHAIIAAYRFRTNVLDNKITTRSLLVVDTGSRKTTVAFARLSGTTDERRFNIEALSVINDLGGQSFDDVLIDLARKRFLRDYQMDIQKTNLRLMHKLTMECQKAKLILSTASEAQITLDSYDDVADITITRAEFEARTRRFVDKCIEAIDDLLRRISIPARTLKLGEVICIGGTMNIPQVAEAITKYAKRSIVKSQCQQQGTYKQQDPLQGIVLGLLGGVSQGIDICPVDIVCCPWSQERPTVCIPRGEALPCLKTLSFPMEEGSTEMTFQLWEGNGRECTWFLAKYPVPIGEDIQKISSSVRVQLHVELKKDLSLSIIHTFIVYGCPSPTLFQLGTEIPSQIVPETIST